MKKKRRNNLENLYTYNSRKDEYEISLSLRNYEEMGECLEVRGVQCYNVTELLRKREERNEKNI